MDKQLLACIQKRAGEVLQESLDVKPTETGLKPTNPDFSAYAERAKLLQTPEDYTAFAGDLLAGATKQDQAARDYLPRFQTQMDQHSKNWTPEQWKTHNQALQKQLTGGYGSPEVVPELAHQAAQKAQKEIETATPGASDAPGAVGWKNWLTNNWQTLAVPAGLIASAFGGNIGKVLGTMAMAAGGYNLYERYKRLTDKSNKFNAPVQAAIHVAAKQTDEQGNPAPFSDLDAVARGVAERYGDPNMAGAIKTSLLDYGFLASHGFKDQMMQRARQAPRQFIRSYFGPRMAEQVAGKAPAPGQFQSTLDRGRQWVSNAVDQVQQHLVPGGSGYR